MDSQIEQMDRTATEYHRLAREEYGDDVADELEAAYHEFVGRIRSIRSGDK